VARRNFYAYKAVNSKIKAFKIKKGNKVEIKKLQVYKNKVYIQVKYKGKTAWMREDYNLYWDSYSSMWDDPLFEKVLYGD
jgi:hypothetical protein